MRRFGTLRTLTTALAAGLVAALASGCGAPNPVNVVLSPATVLQSTVSKLKSSSASSAKVRATISSGSLGEMTMTGVERFTPSPAVQAQVDVSGGQLSSVLGSTMDVVLLDGVEYVKFSGGSMARVTGGKPWLKIDLNQLSAGAGGAGVGSALKLDQNTDPRQQIELLLASGDVKRVGTQAVDGVSTTHYAGTVDPGKVLQATGSGKLTPDEMQSLQSLLQTAGITSEHIDVWLDHSGLPVELKAAVDSSAAGTVTVDEHLSDWGAPVTITAPPADQVSDMSKLLTGR